VALRRQHAGQPPRGVRGRSGRPEERLDRRRRVEPLAVAARPNGDVWVANHLSDSVSVVHVDDDGHAQLIDTLLVGDEPRDIVFAGPNASRAFITTAHRGQNSPDDPDLFASASGRADVWVSMRTIVALREASA